MSKKDYSHIEHNDIPLWKYHEYIDFKTSGQMLEWVSNDKTNFTLSDKVYEAMLYCLKNEMEEFLQGDNELVQMEQKVEYLNTIVFFLESVMNAIKQRDWQIRNSIQWKEFLVGM
jgi:hypothetical protein